ncbi:RNA polymerase sigma factor [Planctomycetota bacterium]
MTISNIKEAITKVIEGDINAFNVIVKAYQTRIRMYAAGLLWDKLQVDDTAQEIFITAYKKIDLYDPEQPFYPWLKGIAYNIIRNANRKFERHQKTIDRFLEFRECTKETVREAHSYIEGLLSYLRECLSDIPETLAAILTEYYMQSRTAEEIAHVQEKPASSIRVMLMRGRERLKECVDRKTGESE